MIPAELPPAAANFAVPVDLSGDLKRPCAQTYYERLHPWMIIRHLPNMQRLVVCRFRKRSEAEAYVNTLRRLSPTATYVIIFDPLDDSSETAIP